MRGLAIAGMFYLHCIPFGLGPIQNSALEWLQDGLKVQFLFAFVDGISIAIIYSRTNRIEDFRRILLVRAVFLIALGLYLTTLNSGIVVILDYYGVAFLVTLLIVQLRWFVVLMIATGLFVTGSAAVVASITALVEIEPIGPFEKLYEWSFVGEYPLVIYCGVIWMGYAFWQSTVGSAERSIGWMTSAALLLFPVLSARALIEDGPLDEVLELATTIFGIVILCVTLGLLETLSKNVRKVGHLELFGLLTSPLIALGRSPLSVYTVQVFVVAIWVQYLYRGWGLLAVCSIASIVVAALGYVLIGRGPVEYVVARACKG